MPENAAPTLHGTTILSVRKDGKVVIAGDGQVTFGNTVLKAGARKVRPVGDGKVIAGFAGATADAFTLFERLEAKLEQYPMQLTRACVELAKDWRTDRYLRQLEAMLAVADRTTSLVLTGKGDVLEPDDGLIGIGSGGPYALAAARALVGVPGMDADAIARKAMEILTTLGSSFGSLPPMRVERIGHGAGRDDLPHPNVLRLMIGTSETAVREEKVMVVETNIDDMNPQFYDYIMEQLLKMGVKEVFLTPVFMKKNRPATLLTAICSLGQMPVVTAFLLRETTTIGLRWREEKRALADREIRLFDTKYGKIRFKLARWDGAVINVSPEYEDCKRLALERKIPLKEVFEEARRLAVTISKGSKAAGILKTR